MVEAPAIEQLAPAFRGRLIGPEDPGYNEARALYNGMIDKRPRLIAQCVDVADVVAAVQFGREQGLLIAVRGGGHNGPGLGSCDDGIVIDLRQMKGVYVDPEASTVRVGAGCTQGDVDHATHAFGLAVPAGIVSTTGIAGLTLGGGHGYLTRKHGLTIDNLLEAQVVLADGSVVTASESQHPDLFWALRGGGGNFGVVTSFLFRAHPVSMVFGGLILWAIQDGPQVMAAYRDFIRQAPEELGVFVGLKTVPAAPPFPEAIWNARICAVIGGYAGDEADGQAAIAPLLQATPEPLMNAMHMMPFPMLQSLFDPLLSPGMQWYWKGDFVRELSDEAIRLHVAHASQSPSPLSLVHIYPIDGAAQRVGSEETAWAARDANYSMVICGIDPDPAKADELRQWARGYWEAVHPFNMDGAYVNFMMDEADGRVRNTYGANYERLQRVKAQYDPDNVFRVNQNIPPAA
jgi:hypothetical protein